MSIPQIDPAVEQDVEKAAGVILKTPKVRNIVAGTLAVVGGVLTVATEAAGSLVVTGHANLIPSWGGDALIIAWAIFTPISTIGHAIWKANVR